VSDLEYSPERLSGGRLAFVPVKSLLLSLSLERLFPLLILALKSSAPFVGDGDLFYYFVGMYFARILS
jgi:hypothetical protein